MPVWNSVKEITVILNNNNNIYIYILTTHLLFKDENVSELTASNNGDIEIGLDIIPSSYILIILTFITIIGNRNTIQEMMNSILLKMM